MSKIFKNLWQVKGNVVLILMLLAIQVYCDLALPNYTSNIVDVGIQQSGIDHVAAEQFSEETFEKMCLLITDEDEAFLRATYQKNDSSVYERANSTKEEIQRLDDLLGMPLMMLSQPQISEFLGSGQMGKAQILAMVDQAKETYGDAMQDISASMTRQMAVQVVKAEYEKLGLDLGQIQMRYLIQMGLIMLGYAVLGMLCALCVGFLSAKSGAIIGKNLRAQVFKKVISFSNNEMNTFSTASLITRSTNDIQQVQIVSTMFLRMVLYAPLMGIGGIFKVMHTDTGLEWIIVVAVVLICALVLLLVAIAMPKFKMMQTLVDGLNLVSREILTGLPVIRAFSREKHEEDRFADANTKLMRTQLFTNRVMTFMMPVMMIIMNAISLGIIWFGAKGVDLGDLQVGDMMAFITYTMMIVMSFLMLTMMSIMLPRAGVAAGRIEELIQSQSSILDPENPVAMPKDRCKGEVAFEDVCFRYEGASDDALSNISFVAKNGQTTAIIGSTGSGKSTMIHLMDRFYDVTSGRITVDGVDIRQMTQHDLHALVGLVPQKGILFTGDIASNIKYEGEHISDEAMKEAAEIAQASDFILEKEKGYESEISQGGTNVSGGQKQRLAIARAIAKNPKIYLFDDSFSALDYKTDTLLRKALSKRTKDATVIIVAQRISTIMHADQILVLDDGKIVGKGTHEELLANCTTYQEIASSQLSEAELKGGKA